MERSRWIARHQDMTSPSLGPCSPAIVARSPPVAVPPVTPSGIEVGQRLKITVKSAQRLPVPAGADCSAYVVIRVGKNEVTHIDPHARHTLP